MTDRIIQDPAYRARLSDELRSIKRLLSIRFTDAEIRWDVPDEDEPYDILIEIPGSTNNKSTKHTERVNHGVVLYWRCKSMIEAADAREDLVALLTNGVPIPDLTTSGWQRLIPLWEWPVGYDEEDGSTGPPPPVDEAKAFLRVRDDVSARIEPQRGPREFTVIVEFTAQAVRVSREFLTSPEINTINPLNTWKV